jgi:hypothetical protein
MSGGEIFLNRVETAASHLPDQTSEICLFANSVGPAAQGAAGGGEGLAAAGEGVACRHRASRRQAWCGGNGRLCSLRVVRGKTGTLTRLLETAEEVLDYILRRLVVWCCNASNNLALVVNIMTGPDISKISVLEHASSPSGTHFETHTHTHIHTDRQTDRD